MGNDWVREYLEVWNSHDGSEVAAFMSEDVTYEDLAGGETYHGHAGIVDYVTQTHVWSSDYRFLVVSAQAGGDRYAIEWEMLGTNTGVLAGIPPTGKPYRIRGASIGQRDGEAKIASNRDYSNLPTTWHRSACSRLPRNARPRRRDGTGSRREIWGG